MAEEKVDHIARAKSALSGHRVSNMYGPRGSTSVVVTETDYLRSIAHSLIVIAESVSSRPTTGDG